MTEIITIENSVSAGGTNQPVGAGKISVAMSNSNCSIKKGEDKR